MSKQETLSVEEYRALTGQRRLPAVLAPIPEPKRSKYNAKKTIVDGITFDSKAEADRWCSLKNLERARVIRGLGRQPVFALRGVGGKAIAKFKADFIYLEAGRTVVEDTKGVQTPAFKLKAKLFLEQYGHDHELRLTDKHGNIKPFKVRYPKVAA